MQLMGPMKHQVVVEVTTMHEPKQHSQVIQVILAAVGLTAPSLVLLMAASAAAAVVVVE